MNAKKLQIGHKIYRINDGEVDYVDTIESVTNQQAVSELGTVFRRKLVDLQAIEWGEINQSGFGKYIYHLETEELKLTDARKRLIWNIKSEDFKDVSLDDLRKIYSIIMNKK